MASMAARRAARSPWRISTSSALLGASSGACSSATSAAGPVTIRSPVRRQSK
jgi:hypothetical protein